MPNAEPFFFPGEPGKPGILLIHGFTGTPQNLRGMGQYLNSEQGYTCMGIRLAGHGTSPEDMARTKFTDWIVSAEQGFKSLTDVVDDIYLAGLSMGGALALLLSTRLQVRGVISMATPFDLGKDWRLNFTGLLALFQPYLPKQADPPGAGWYDKAAYKEYVSYDCNPVRSVTQLRKLLRIMRDSLPKVKVPVLLMHSRQDVYPIKDSMPLIFERLGTQDKECLWLEGSGHVITMDAQRETVFRASANFIRRVEELPHKGTSQADAIATREISGVAPE